MAAEIETKEKKIFEGKRIYFSGSLSLPHPDPELFPSLVGFMQDGGAIVFSSHVAVRDPEERNSLFLRNSGIRREDMDPIDAAVRIREADLSWVNEASDLVAIITPSFGIGSEVQRALDKHLMGMDITPVLCLIHQEDWDKPGQNLAKGICKKDSPVAFVKKYKDIDEAKRLITEFLTSPEIADIVQWQTRK